MLTERHGDCTECGESTDPSVGLYVEIGDTGICTECEKFCPICGQEHNADDAGYCQHCKEPIIDVPNGKFF